MKIPLVTLNSREYRWCYKAILFILFTCLLCVTLTFSGSSNDHTETAKQEQRPAIGTRGLGLSGAFISSVDDATSPLWNPAGLASLESGNLIYDFSQGAISFAYPINRIGTFGVNLIDLNTTDRFLLNHTSNPIGTFEYGYNQALLSYARKFGVLQLGASAGYNRAPYKNSLWSPNYDIGALVTLSPKAYIGMQFRDINKVTIRDETGLVLTTFEPQLALGTTLIPHKTIRWHTCYNITSAGFGTSLEFITGPISANVGSLFTFEDFGFPDQSWSLGLSFNKWGKQTYYTYLNQENLEYKHLISFGFTFGGLQHTSNVHEKNQVEPISNGKTFTDNTPLTDINKPKETETEKSDPTKTTIPTEKPIPQKCVSIAKKHNISVELMLAIIYVESKFNPNAVSRTGAGGLMQMIPSTARELGLKVPNYSNKLKPSLNGKVDERFDTVKNLEAGITYFNQLRKKYQNNLTLALGAYNVGPGKVRINGPLINRGKIYADKVIDRRNQYQKNAKLLETDLTKLEVLLNN